MDSQNDEDEFRRFDPGVSFISVFNTKLMKEVKVRNVNANIVSIPYNNEQETIEDLQRCFKDKVQNYSQIVFLVEGRHCQVAHPSEKIQFYVQGKSPDQIIFNVSPKGLMKEIKIPASSKMIEFQIRGKESQFFPFHVMDSLLVEQIKELLSEKAKVSKKQIRLVHKAKVLDNSHSLSKYGIESGDLVFYSKIYLSQGCFRPTARLWCQGGSQPLSQLGVGSPILSFNQRSLNLEPDQVIFMEKVQIFHYIVIKMSNGEQIECTANHRFLCCDGRWKMYQSSRSGERLEIGEELVHVRNEKVRVVEIVERELCKGEVFWHPSVRRLHNFIVCGVVAHNLHLYIVPVYKEGSEIMFSFEPSMLIDEMKRFIEKETGVKAMEQILFFAGKKLEDGKSIRDYNINKEAKVYFKVKHDSLIKMNALSIESKIVKSQPEGPKGKTINLVTSQESVVQLSYEENRKKTAKEIIRENRANPSDNYCLLFGEVIILPNDKLMKIEQSEEFEATSELMIKVITSGDKYLLGKMLTNPVFNPGLFKSQLGMQQDLSEFKALKYYTTGEFSDRIKQYLKEFMQRDLSSSKEHHFCDALIAEMRKLERFDGTCYFASKRIRISQMYTPGQIFIVPNFCSTSKNDNTIMQLSQFGTIFKVRSISGRDISRLSAKPEQKEVLFFPYTYFVIDKIISFPDYDRVELTELCSPVTFTKNIIVWVDDRPKNNHKEIKLLESEWDLEVVQLVSTKGMETWIKEFGWFLNWKDIKFKIVSDMSRVEEDGVDNKEAGLELALKMFNELGITNPIAIFTMDRDRVLARMKERNVRKDRICEVFVRSKEIIEYCKKF